MSNPLNPPNGGLGCSVGKFIVYEVDGSIHELPENKVYDIGRTELLNDFGITVIRFANEQVFNDKKGAADKIKQFARELLSEATKVP